MALRFVIPTVLLVLSVFFEPLAAHPMRAGPGCQKQTFSAQSGFIQSYGFPGNYSNELDCVQEITVDEGHRVQLVFYTFETEQNSDFVALYDGLGANKQLITRLSGSDPMHQSYESTGNSMTVEFLTDFDHTYKGYYARFDQLRPDQTPPLVQNCGAQENFQDPYGVIVSPLWPLHYPNEALCYYKIHIPAARGITIRINFFETEPRADTLSIYAGQVESASHLIKILSGNQIRDSMYFVPSNTALLVFSSDFTNTYPGFSVTYYKQ